MKIKGKVTKITPVYPYEVTVGNVTFTSHFMFKVGMEVNLSFEGNEFNAPWPRGFINCWPNGFTEYQMDDAVIKTCKSGDSVSRRCLYLPANIQQVIATGKTLKWQRVESFYNYHYSAEFNRKTKVLKTNWAIRA